MNALRLFVAAVLLWTAGSHSLEAQETHTYYVFKITGSIPVSLVKLGDMNNDFVDKVSTKTLKTNDIINLALGRALGTKVTSDLSLAMALTFEELGEPVLSKMIVYDAAGSGPGVVKTVIATLDSLDFDVAYLGRRRKGSGFGAGTFKTTTLGDPTKWAILQSEFSGGGLSSGPLQKFKPNAPFPVVSPVATATLQGRFKFRTTDGSGMTTDFSGIFTRAAFKLNGKILATYEE